MKYIIGLGNPGDKYKLTRHNVAWLIFDAIGLSGWKNDKYMNAVFADGEIDDNLVLYIKPETFMNRSGEIINMIKKSDNFSYDDVIILHDDIDLEFGKIRISFNSGDGGHNGVKSILKYTKTKKIIRIRVGISKKDEVENGGGILKPNVLSNFSKSERSYIKDIISLKVNDILKVIILDGVDKAMNLYN